jgi:hypothetical protein
MFLLTDELIAQFSDKSLNDVTDRLHIIRLTILITSAAYLENRSLRSNTKTLC